MLTDPKTKIKTVDELRPVVKTEQARGRRVIFGNGCFDLIHVGHVRYLEDARSLGDTLIVGINSDASVRTIKGVGRPLQPEGDRAEIIAALQCVDYVVLFDEPTVERVLLALRPDVHAKGTDYTRASVPEREIVRSYGGEVAIVGDPKSHSSRDMIQIILAKMSSWLTRTTFLLSA